DRAALWSLFRDQPARAYDLTWIAAVEEHFLGEALALLGHMSGIERVARAFVRLHERGNALGLLEDDEMPMPYRQQDLADALGLSLVHTNKTLRQLREERVAIWRDGRLRFLNRARLLEIAGLEGASEPVTRPLI
ncbi:MAG: helix-turn-helix domain-containing protein, partial [Roseovarius sp.]